MRILFTLLLSFTTILMATAQRLERSNKPVSDFLLKGHIDGIKDGTKVYLHNVDEQIKIDSAVSKNGNFTMKGSVKQPSTCWVECKDQYAIIQVENTIIEFNAPLANMRLYATAKAGPEQELQNQMTALQHPYEIVFFMAYDSLTKNLFTSEKHKQQLIQQLKNYQDSAQMIYVEFGKTHPNSYLGADILYRNRQQIGAQQLEPLYQAFNDKLKESTKGQALQLFIFGKLAKQGDHFIDFEAEDINGTFFQLSSLKGQYILLSFWNAGCAPCRRENKKISKEYEQLRSKIYFVSFSTDKVKQAWIKASEEDGILWSNVSDLKGDNGRIKTQYDVQAIPTSYLINKEGIIVEKFVGLDEDFLEKLQKIIRGK